MRFLSLLCSVVVAASTAVLGSVTAHASIVSYPLTTCFLSVGCAAPGATYGNVVVAPISATEVSVTLNLSAGEVMATTGAGKPLLFDVAGDPNITVSNISDPSAPHASFAFISTPGGTHADGTGSWYYYIGCVSGCGSGSNAMLPGPLTFDVSLAGGITPASFVRNSQGFYFASDVGVPAGAGGYNTGDVGAPSVVPLPAAGLLLGSALLLGLLCAARPFSAPRSAAGRS